MTTFINVFFFKLYLRLCLQADVDKAVKAARKAFDIESPWRKLEPAARGNLMRKFCSLLRRDVDYLSVGFVFLAFFNSEPKTIFRNWKHLTMANQWKIAKVMFWQRLIVLSIVRIIYYAVRRKIVLI
jgi:hypothetical protein